MIRSLQHLGRRERWLLAGTLVALVALVVALLPLAGTVSLGRDPADQARTVASPTEDRPPSGAESLNDILEPIRAANRVPALGVAIVRGDRLAAIGMVGVRKAGTAVRVTYNDRVHIGSCAKSMTAALIGLLVDEGRLRWDTRLSDVFPELRDGIRPEYRSVTVDQLLHHQAGLPGDRNGADYYRRVARLSGSHAEQRLHLVEWALQQPPVAAPGTQCIYANAGFNILGAIAERVTGSEWEDLLRTRLFAPLDMDSARFGTPSAGGGLDQPWGHRPVGRYLRRLKPDSESHQPPATWAAGNVQLTLADWAKYAAWHLQAAQGRYRLLSGAVFEHLHAPVSGTSYACGWGAGPDPRLGYVLGHAGSIGTWYAEIWLAPERDAALLIAVNEGEPRGVKACHDALEALYPRFAPASPAPASAPAVP